MRPYFQCDNITIYHGDCREVLPQLSEASFDLVLTDPPYKLAGGGPSKSSESAKWAGSVIPNGKSKIFAHNEIRFEEWFPLAFRAASSRSQCYVFVNDKNLRLCLNAAEEAGFNLHNVLIWKKDNLTPNKWYMKNCEFIPFFWKGEAHNINDMGSSQLLEFPNPRNKQHPTEKPVPLLEYLLTNSTTQGQIVLDPFFGSGAILEAAKNLNRRAVGIEIEERYCEIAAKRLQQGVQGTFSFEKERMA